MARSIVVFHVISTAGCIGAPGMGAFEPLEGHLMAVINEFSLLCVLLEIRQTRLG